MKNRKERLKTKNRKIRRQRIILYMRSFVETFYPTVVITPDDAGFFIEASVKDYVAKNLVHQVLTAPEGPKVDLVAFEKSAYLHNKYQGTVQIGPAANFEIEKLRWASNRTPNDKSLEGINPWSNDLTDQQKAAILDECKNNFAYFASICCDEIFGNQEVQAYRPCAKRINAFHDIAATHFLKEGINFSSPYTRFGEHPVIRVLCDAVGTILVEGLKNDQASSETPEAPTTPLEGNASVAN